MRYEIRYRLAGEAGVFRTRAHHMLHAEARLRKAVGKDMVHLLAVDHIGGCGWSALEHQARVKPMLAVR